MSITNERAIEAIRSWGPMKGPYFDEDMEAVEMAVAALSEVEQLRRERDAVKKWAYDQMSLHGKAFALTKPCNCKHCSFMRSVFEATR